MAETTEKTDMADLHDAVAEAYEEHSTPDETPESVETPEPAPEPEEPEEDAPERDDEPEADEPEAEGRTRDPKTGKFLPKKGEEKAGPPAKPVPPVKPPTGQPPANPQTAQTKPGAVPPPQQTAPKPPQSWRPVAREKWAALDPVVREEVLRREREVNITLQKTAEARGFHEEFQRSMAPFLPMMAANGHTPLQSIQGLAQTAAALQMGPPAQKVAIAAAIIQQYGIDLNALADALEGAPQAQQAQQGFRDPRVDQLLAMQQQQAYAAQQAQAAQEARQAQELQSHYEKFAEEHEFFNDVRQAMAALVQVKFDTEGVDLSDEEAYDMAVSLRPDLQAIKRDRETYERATNPNGSTARAAAAAVSLKPGSVTAKKGADPENLRAILEESVDEVMGRK